MSLLRKAVTAAGTLLAAGTLTHVLALFTRRGGPPPTMRAFATSVLNAVPAPMGYCGADQRLRYVNRRYAEVVGRSAAELVGQRLSDVIPKYTALVESHILAALGGEPQRFEHPASWSAGVRVHEVHYMPHVLASGEVVGFYVMGFDISALKESQDQLRNANLAFGLARDEAEKASTAKSAFLANMSHEIRTPMNAILGLTELLAHGVSDPVQRDRVGKIGAAARHLLQLINENLDLAKISAGKVVLTTQDFSRDALVTGTFEMVLDQARRKGLEPIIDTDGLPERLHGDPTRLSQMVINLLSNAVKFTETGWVRLRAAQVNGRSDARMLVRFEVTDTGAGITPERCEQLFFPYEQVGAGSQEPGRGTGLGLAVTRQLARAMGGDAGVQSELGVGSTFWFTVWLDHAHRPEERKSLLDGRRALVVDEIPEARQVIDHDLRLLGLTVGTAAGVNEAIELLTEGSPTTPVDVLLLDWKIADTDDLHALRRVRALLGRHARRSVLLVSGVPEEMRAAARAAGFDRVIEKPVTLSALHAVLAELLQPDAQPAASPEPEARSLPSGARIETSLREHHAGQRVLLAEDNPINREIAGEMLRAVGLVVEEAVDGQAALELARRWPADLILLDVRMPKLGGIDIARTLREEGCRTPILAVTANAFLDDRAACLEAGMDDHIAKPMSMDTLYRALLRWLPTRVTPQAPPPPAAVPAPADAPDRAAMLRALERIDGFDVASALEAFAGDDVTLLRAIDEFALFYARGLAAPGAANRTDLSRTLADACHSLFGAAATIGVTQVADRARQLERRLAAEGETEALAAEAERLGEDLRVLARELKAALHPGAIG